MWTHTNERRRRALLAGVLAGACALGLLAFAAPAAEAAYKAQVQTGTLRITGDTASDKLALSASPVDPNILQLDVGEDGTTDFAFDRSTFTAINVQAGGGDDEVRLDPFVDLGNVTVNGGGGNDTIIGGAGADVLLGGSGNDVIDGGRGNDTVDLGSGNDRFLWDPGDGSDNVEGGVGNDVLEFHGSNASEQIAVAANGSRVRLSRDVAAIIMDLNGVEGLDLSTLGGTDTVAVGDLTGTALRTANVDLSGFRGSGTGDSQADTVIVNGTDGADHAKAGSSAGSVLVSGLSTQVKVSGADATTDNVDVDTLGGDDTIESGVGLAGPAAVNVDGGSGSDTATYSGTTVADAIGIGLFGTGLATFTTSGTPLVTSEVENLNVRGLGGDDTIVGQNGIAGLTALTIDGGAGNDTLRGGDGNDLLLGGVGNDLVDGGRGNDVADLGTGNDTFTWDPGDASDTVEGQGGSDTVDFNGANIAEKFDVSANGSRVRLVRDVGAVIMDLNGIVNLNLTARAGADTITVGNLSGTALKNASIDLGGLPGTGVGDATADTIVENGTDAADLVKVVRSISQVQSTGLVPRLVIGGSDPGIDTLQVNTIGGHDTVTVAPDVSALINTVVDLGADQ